MAETTDHSGMTDFEKAGKVFSDFCRTIAALRHPETGCPWDIEQTHASLRRYMIEEAYEASEVMAADDHQEICEELGDVLLQVVLNAQLGADAKKFAITDVVESIHQKMRRRHPHVFAPKSGQDVSDAALHKQWNEIKAEEKGPAPENEGVFSGKNIRKAHPATRKALEIGKQAKKIDFDWQNAREVADKLKEEFDELFEALNSSDFKSSESVSRELGDVYFSLSQLTRHLKLDPEIVSEDGNRKFLNRFSRVEELAAKRGIDVRSAGQDVLEKLWTEVKRK